MPLNAPDPLAPRYHHDQVPADPATPDERETLQGCIIVRTNGHQAAYPWPLDVSLQGGTEGVVFDRAKKTAYTTAFIEAFPTNPSTFIRGQGATVAEAETDAWNKYQRVTNCTGTNGHEFESRGYTNGAGFCKHCALFATEVFTGADLGQFCATCDAPTTWQNVDDEWYCRLHQAFDEFDLQARLRMDAYEAESAASTPR